MIKLNLKLVFLSLLCFTAYTGRSYGQSLMPSDFSFWTTDYGIYHSSYEENIGKYNLGKVGWNLPTKATTNDGQKKIKIFAEWDWMYYGLKPGDVDGSGHVRDNVDCYGNYLGCYIYGPQTKVEGYNKLASFWRNHKPLVDQGETLASMVGHYNFQGYAARFGAGLTGSENGAGTGNWQVHMAFTRGAAKSYNIDWFMDFSSWYGPSVKNYTNFNIAPGNSACPACGHSDSARKRMMFMSFMGGTNYIHDESGGLDYFHQPVTGTTTMELTLTGKVVKDFLDFVRGYKISYGRPESFVPIAIVTDEFHGASINWSDRLTWQYVPFTKADGEFYNIINSIFWPGSIRTVYNQPENEVMVNTYYGEIADVITDSTDNYVSQSNYSKYKVLMFVGDVNFTEILKNKLVSYLDQGGSIFLYGNNALQYTYLQNSAGTRNIYTPKDLNVFHNDVSLLLNDIMPFLVQSGLQTTHQINKIDENNWIVTILNNGGVSKQYTTAEVVDQTKKQKIIITATKNKEVDSVTKVYGKYDPVKNGSTEIFQEVDPGDVQILKISFKIPSSICTPFQQETRKLSCPINQSGTIEQSRQSYCSAGSTSQNWTEWSTVSNTCALLPVNEVTVGRCIESVPDRKSFSFLNVWSQNFATSNIEVQSLWEQVTGHSLYDGNLVYYLIVNYRNGTFKNYDILNAAANSSDAASTISAIWLRITGDNFPSYPIYLNILSGLKGGSMDIKYVITLASEWSSLKSKIDSVFQAYIPTYVVSDSDFIGIQSGLRSGRIMFSDIDTIARCMVAQ